MPEENLQNNINNLIGASNVPKKPDNKSYYGKLKPLRTYQGDVSETIGKTKASVVTIAVAEQKRQSKTEPKEEKVPSEAGNKFFIVAGTILFLLGIVTVGVFYFMSLQNKTTQVVQSGAILSYDQQVKIPVASSTRDAMIEKIEYEEQDLNLPVNSILYMNTADGNSPADVQKVLPMLAPQIPPQLLRNLSQNYMLGIYSFSKNVPFIILTVDDYGTGFSGMLEWEKTMVSDLGPIFDIGTSSPDGGYVFTDESLSNKDLRIVQNGSRQTVLLYSFVDKSTIIITGDENTFNALLNKYLDSKMVK